MTALLAPPGCAFVGSSSTVSAAVRARMEGCSWHGDDPRCPRFGDLAYVECDHLSFDGSVQRGELVVAASVAAKTLRFLRRLFELGFPIRSMRLVDDFGASDDASMAADNSSAFNFRLIAGTELISKHSFGRAIDLNPVENPWRRPGRIDPPAGEAFADRAVIRPGMFVRPGPAIGAADELGFEWGGDWTHASDDHHFVA